MPTIVGFLIVFGSVLAGFMMHGGNPVVLLQWNEFIIIGGAAFGSMIIANGVRHSLYIIRSIFALLKGNPFSKERYTQLLVMLFELLTVARSEGMMKLEEHIENPEASEIIRRYPSFLSNDRALSFLTDTTKVILSGTVSLHELDMALDMDIEQYHQEAMFASHEVKKAGEAMPGFGIVAAVLGVILTMGKIGGDPSEIGQSIAAALVGTFLGVLLAYGVCTPLAAALATIARSELAYLTCIKTTLLAFLKGDSPMTCVEYARRTIEPELRPTFAELELRIREVKTRMANK